MSKYVCRLCDRLVLSQSVTYADDTLTINIPAGTYGRGQRYCIVIAQSIPTTATITAPVVITIGDGTETYPLTTSNCTQVVASGIRTRTRYAVQVVTNATGGSFRLLGRPCCSPSYALTGLDGTTTETTGGADNG